MSEKYKIGESERPHFITITVIDWLDLFTRPTYKDIVVDSLNYCIKHKSLSVYAYCIMSSHVHFIASSQKVGLNEVIRDLKNLQVSNLYMRYRKLQKAEENGC